MNQGRVIAYIPSDGHVEGRGWRVSLVEEGTPGHSPTGTWPYFGRAGETLPWFWGPSYTEACQEAERFNEKSGISKEEAFRILTSSMRGGRVT